MSLDATSAPASAPASASRSTALVRRNWQVPVTLAVVGVVVLVFFSLLAPDTLSSFNLSGGGSAVELEPLSYPTRIGGAVAAVIVLAAAAYAATFTWHYRKVPLWITTIAVIVAVIAFLGWAGADRTVQVPGLLSGALAVSVPLVYGALAGVISERGGVVNVAIEGQLLAGAFAAAVVSSLTDQPIAGLIAAAVAGGIVSLLLALFAIKYFVEQVIVGVVINVLISGLTAFLMTQVLSENTALLNDPEPLVRIAIPFLSDIPVIGPTLFRQSLTVYIMYVLVAVVAFALYRTRWGLRLRSVGEHPQAADTVGINVGRTRFRAVMLGGLIAGAGGAYITLSQAGAFNQDVTNGVGFIALAAVIFGRWDPIRATLAALLFGFATNLQNALSVLGQPVPSEFMLMLPYVVTILAVAGLVGRSRAPAADGVPYIKS